MKPTPSEWYICSSASGFDIYGDTIWVGVAYGPHKAGPPSFPDDEQCLANARLMAASPELATALANLINAIHGPLMELTPAVTNARAVLAKARGE